MIHIEAQKAQLGKQIAQLMEDKSMNRNAVVKAAGGYINHAQLNHVLDGSKNYSINTFLLVAGAVGLEV
jgi:hypothetical protein